MMNDNMKKKMQAMMALMEDIMKMCESGEQEEKITSLDQMREAAEKKSAQPKKEMK